MSSPAASILILARAPRRGEVRRALEPLLGPDACAALQAELISVAARWAQSLAPGAVHVAYEPPDAGPELRPLVGPDPILFPQNGDGISGRVADAAARVFARSHAPLLIVWPDLPVLSLAHGRMALEDLACGCDIVFGPAIDGGFYLVGIARPLPELFALPEQAWRNPDTTAAAVAAARTGGLEIGLLRAERPLQRPADVRAALADPLLPESIARLLGRARTANG